MNKDIVLSISDLVVQAPNGATLVDHVDVTLKRGEVLGLIGESGAGKSTIGLAAMGYGRGGCRIAEGTIVVDDVSLMDGTRETRERCAAHASPTWRRARQRRSIPRIASATRSWKARSIMAS